MTLALLLKRTREDKHMDQVDLAKVIEVAQSTVSAWETGTQVPSRKYRMALANALGIDLDRVEKEVMSAAARPRPARILSQREYLRQQQRYLDDLGEASGKVRVTFVGPEHLPVLDSPEVEETWVKNLLSGVDYAVLWFLCLVEQGALRRLAPRFRSIGGRVASLGKVPCGRIFHLGLRLFSPRQDAVYESNAKDFGECGRAEFPANAWILCSQDKDIGEPLRRRLLQQYVPHGSLVVYYHREVGFPRLASVSLRAVRTSPEASEQAAFHFLGKRQCDDLYDLLTDFFSTVKLHEVPQPSNGGGQ